MGLGIFGVICQHIVHVLGQNKMECLQWYSLQGLAQHNLGPKEKNLHEAFYM